MRGRKPQNFLFQRQNHLYQPGWHNSDQWNTCGQLGTLSEYCSNKASTACSHQSPEEISGTGNTMLYQLSLDQNDTKMLKRNYIKEKKKKKNSWSFHFQKCYRICSPSEKVLRGVGAGEGKGRIGKALEPPCARRLSGGGDAELGVLSWMRWGLVIFKDK